MNEPPKQQARVRTDERAREMRNVSVNIRQNVALTACPFCGSAVEPDYEICPVCGHKLVEYCTFCGANMTANDIDCPECGMPSEGIPCPDCGALNLRSFCRKCSRPLSRAARKAVEKAKADPKVQEAVSILVKMAELEAEMQNTVEEDDITDDTPHEPTEKELRLRELMGKVGFKPAEKPKVQPKQNTSRSREEIQNRIPAHGGRSQQGTGIDVASCGKHATRTTQLLHRSQSGRHGDLQRESDRLLHRQTRGEIGMGLRSVPEFPPEPRSVRCKRIWRTLDYKDRRCMGNT